MTQISWSDVFGRSFLALMRNFIPFMALSLICYLPLAAYYYLFPSFAASLTTSATLTELALQLVLSGLVTGALVYGVYQHMLGTPAGIGKCISVGIARTVPVVLVSIVVGLAIMLGLLLLIVPGLIILCMWYVAVPVAVIEGHGVSRATARSTFLTQGNRLQVFLLGLILGLTAAGVNYLTVKLFGTPLVWGPDGFQVSTLGLVGHLVPVAAYGAWSACAQAVTYHDLRAVREGVSLEGLASVF